MKPQPVVALHRVVESPQEVRPREQPRDLVFVLVRQQPEVIIRHAGGELRRATTGGLVCGACRPDDTPVTIRIPRVLVVAQEVRPHLDERREVRRRPGVGVHGFRVHRACPPRLERRAVALHLHAVQFDRAQQRRSPQRHQAALPGEPQHVDIREDTVAERLVRQLRCRQESCAVFDARFGQHRGQRIDGRGVVRIEEECRRHVHVGVDDGVRPLRRRHAQYLRTACGHLVAGE